MWLEGLVSKHRDRPMSERAVETPDQGEEPQAPGDGVRDGSLNGVVLSGKFAQLRPTTMQKQS
jgi:hypothetical protein